MRIVVHFGNARSVSRDLLEGGQEFLAVMVILDDGFLSLPRDGQLRGILYELGEP